jgi:hypothetical protein
MPEFAHRPEMSEVGDPIPGNGVFHLEFGPEIAVVEMHPAFGEVGHDTIEVNSKSESGHLPSQASSPLVQQTDSAPEHSKICAAIQIA